MHNNHDELFRHTFSQPEHTASLLRTILPPVLANAIQWATLRLVAGTSIDEALKSRHADLLFTARLLSGQTLLIYLLLAHKSGHDPWTALQLLRYSVRVYDQYLAEHKEATTLPPIVPIVIHHGPKGWTAARSVLELIDLGSLPPAVREVLAPLQPNLRFLLDDLATMPEAELEARGTTILTRLTLLLLQFVRGAEERDPAEFVARWLSLMRALWDHPGARHTLIALFSYLASQLEASRERITAAAILIHEDAFIMGKTIADQFREEGFKKGHDQGVAQGVAEGKATGMVELLLRQLRKRFGTVPMPVEALVRSANLDNLDAWAERILTAATLDQVFGS